MYVELIRNCRKFNTQCGACIKGEIGGFLRICFPHLRTIFTKNNNAAFITSILCSFFQNHISQSNPEKTNLVPKYVLCQFIKQLYFFNPVSFYFTVDLAYIYSKSVKLFLATHISSFWSIY